MKVGSLIRFRKNYHNEIFLILDKKLGMVITTITAFGAFETNGGHLIYFDKDQMKYLK